MTNEFPEIQGKQGHVELTSSEQMIANMKLRQMEIILDFISESKTIGVLKEDQIGTMTNLVSAFYDMTSPDPESKEVSTSDRAKWVLMMNLRNEVAKQILSVRESVLNA